MTPVRPRYGRIEQLADTLLIQAGIKAPFVPIEDIANTRGITIRVMDLKEVSGLLVRDSNVTVIGVNKTHPLTRRRFTIAHECAHALLHDGRKSVTTRISGSIFRSAYVVARCRCRGNGGKLLCRLHLDAASLPGRRTP